MATRRAPIGMTAPGSPRSWSFDSSEARRVADFARRPPPLPPLSVLQAHGLYPFGFPPHWSPDPSPAPSRPRSRPQLRPPPPPPPLTLSPSFSERAVGTTRQAEQTTTAWTSYVMSRTAAWHLQGLPLVLHQKQEALETSCNLGLANQIN